MWSLVSGRQLAGAWQVASVGVCVCGVDGEEPPFPPAPAASKGGEERRLSMLFSFFIWNTYWECCTAGVGDTNMKPARAI